MNGVLFNIGTFTEGLDTIKLNDLVKNKVIVFQSDGINKQNDTVIFGLNYEVTEAQEQFIINNVDKMSIKQQFTINENFKYSGRNMISNAYYDKKCVCCKNWIKKLDFLHCRRGHEIKACLRCVMDEQNNLNDKINTTFIKLFESENYKRTSFNAHEMKEIAEAINEAFYLGINECNSMSEEEKYEKWEQFKSYLCYNNR